MSAYFVMAKMDNGDGPFDEDLVNERYPTNFMLVPGHVWLVVADADSEGSYDVAKSLGLVSGGTEEASGMVVPAKGYWGFAHKSLWQLLQPDGHPPMLRTAKAASWRGKFEIRKRGRWQGRGKRTQHGKPSR